jgi:hypothetical protein
MLAVNKNCREYDGALSRWAGIEEFVLEHLLESPPVSAVPLKDAGGPTHAYDMLGDGLAQELYALGQNCLFWSRPENDVVIRKGISDMQNSVQ